MTACWVSCEKFTCRIDIDKNGIIIFACPFLHRFVGQPASNLTKWCKSKGWNLTVEKLYGPS